MFLEAKAIYSPSRSFLLVIIMKYVIPFVFALLLFGCTVQPEVSPEQDVVDEPQAIGGQRGLNGCLGPAGYSFNADINACVREWELSEQQKRAARIAVEHVGAQKGLTVTEVLVAKCPGCFVVRFDLYGEELVVELDDWKVKGAALPVPDIGDDRPEAEQLAIEHIKDNVDAADNIEIVSVERLGLGSYDVKVSYSVGGEDQESSVLVQDHAVVGFGE